MLLNTKAIRPLGKKKKDFKTNSIDTDRLQKHLKTSNLHSEKTTDDIIKIKNVVATVERREILTQQPTLEKESVGTEVTNSLIH